ncbi:MAG: 6-phosphogluconolactonase [Candidatus Peribacteraceae bacterium]
MQTIVTSSASELTSQALAFVRGIIAQDDGIITIGLSGGSTPVALYNALGADDSLPWDQFRFFLVDDRYVPSDHADSNQRLVRSTLLAHHHAKLLAPDTTLDLPQCVQDYDERLQGIIPDLVILGMGDDGHIASLFPPVSPDAFGEATVIHTTTENFSVHDRLSVTLPFLESAKHRLFLISGEKKIALFRSQEHENQDPSMFPAHALFDQRTTWLLGSY